MLHAANYITKCYAVRTHLSRVIVTWIQNSNLLLLTHAKEGYVIQNVLYVTNPFLAYSSTFLLNREE